MVGLHEIRARGRITSQGVTAEVLIGQTQVGLIGVLRGVPQLQFQLLVRIPEAIRVDADLPHVIVHIEAGARLTRQLLEAARVQGVRLQQPTESCARGSGPSMALETAVLPSRALHEPSQTVRYACRYQIESPPDRAGSVPHLTRSLPNFQCLHPSCDREVVGRGSRVRCWRDQHAVFHEGDLRAALAARPSQSDIRA